MIRAWLVKFIGADRLVKAAFMEGFSMATEIDPLVCRKSNLSHSKVSQSFRYARTWRSAAEAWANSDAEERFK